MLLFNDSYAAVQYAAAAVQQVNIQNLWVSDDRSAERSVCLQTGYQMETLVRRCTLGIRKTPGGPAGENLCPPKPIAGQKQRQIHSGKIAKLLDAGLFNHGRYPSKLNHTIPGTGLTVQVPVANMHRL